MRCTAIALGYNVTSASSAASARWSRPGWSIAPPTISAPAFMIMAAAAVSFLAMLSFREGDSRTPLPAVSPA